jgi:3-mercaptopyruvate sulfurtransferase SseA
MLNLPLELTTKEVLKDHLDDPSSVIIDIRQVDAYNGWKLQNERRGGHIKGAKSLTVKWSAYPELPMDHLPRYRQLIYPEYIGEVSWYNYIEKTGRIPGTVLEIGLSGAMIPTTQSKPASRNDLLHPTPTPPGNQ